MDTKLKLASFIASIVVIVGGGIWGASAAYTNIITGQESLQNQFDEHLTGSKDVVAVLDSIHGVLQQHLKWDTVYVITQGHLDEMQQRDIADIRKDIKELKGR